MAKGGKKIRVPGFDVTRRAGSRKPRRGMADDFVLNA
jgi:hypothetical protein